MATLSPPFSPSAEYSPPGETMSRPRAVSALSNNSKRSRRSSSSGTKLDFTEAHSDKKWLHTKADPTKALNEAQPGEPLTENPQKNYFLLTVLSQPLWHWKNQILEICARWSTRTLQETSSVSFQFVPSGVRTKITEFQCLSRS